MDEERQEQNPGDPEEESGDVADGEAGGQFDEQSEAGGEAGEGEPAGEELPAEEKYRREAQSEKDKRIAAERLAADLQNRLVDFAGRLNPPAGGDGGGEKQPTLSEYIDSEWGGDPVLKKMAKELEEVKAVQAQQSQASRSQVLNQAASTLQEFTKEHPEIISDIELGDKFVDEINDRLPDEWPFERVVTAIKAGNPIPDIVAKKLKTKMERSLAVVSNGVSAALRAEDAKKRRAQRDGTQGASTPPAAPQSKKKTQKPDSGSLDDYEQARQEALGY